MLGVRRFDPTAAAGALPAAATSNDALRAAVEQRRAAKRRKLDGEPAAGPPAKSVSFSTEPPRTAPAPAPAPSSDVAAAKPTPGPPVQRSKAQQKAHAKKQRRYKENKREAKALARARAAGVDDAGPLEAAPSVEASAPVDPPAPPVDDVERARRKAEKRAKREARRAATAPMNAAAAPADDAEPIRPAHHDVLIQRAHASSKKTKRKRGDAATTAVEPAAPPDHPDALPRFVRGKAPDAPSAQLLDSLAIAEDLREAIVVDEAQVLPLADLARPSGLGEARPLLSDRMRQILSDAGISDLFAVQSAVLPLLLTSPTSQQLYVPAYDPLGHRDLCVNAPTGSGKTLAYVVPIVETLSGRVVTRLRALVVLPTRDLALQARETFQTFTSGTDLRIGMATGAHSLERERKALVGEDVSGRLGGVSRVDILLATPGRLLEHLRSTPGFSLQHLRFLVVDEADRLLGQNFAEWLPVVMSHLSSASSSIRGPLRDGDAVSPAQIASVFPTLRHAFDRKSLPTVQKLLFSATLSRDPAQLAAVELRRPIYLEVRSGAAATGSITFALPAALSEHYLTSSPEQKPLLLFHLLHSAGVGHALCFTKSIEAATRFAKLVELFEAARSSDSRKLVAAAYSSDQTPAERARILTAFKGGKIDLLVCSDLIARGIDLPDVEHVVNYDAPVDMRKYVHRVGRTARAGRAGSAWTLVERQEGRAFKAMLGAAGRTEHVKRVNLQAAQLESLRPAYETALSGLRDAFGRE